MAQNDQKSALPDSASKARREVHTVLATIIILGLIFILTNARTSYAQAAGNIQVTLSANNIDAGQNTVITADVNSLAFNSQTYLWGITGSCPDFIGLDVNTNSFVYYSTIDGETNNCQFTINVIGSNENYIGNGISPLLTVNMPLSIPYVPTSEGNVLQGDIAAIDTLPATMGGTYPITYTWLISNSIDGGFAPATEAQCTMPSGTAVANSQISCTTDSNTVPGTYYYEVQFTDSANTPEITVSTPSTNMTTVFATTSAALACSPFDVGGSTLCTVAVAGSDPTGNVLFTVSNGIGSFTQNLPVQCTLNASGSCSIGFTSNTAGTATITANYVGDTYHYGSAGANQVTINPQLGFPGQPSVITPIDEGQIESVTSDISNVIGTGTGPITYSLYYAWFYAQSFPVSDATCSTSGTTVTCTYVPTAAGIYNYVINATDNAPTPGSTNSAMSANVTVNQFTIGSIYPDMDLVSLNETGKLSIGTPTNGTPPYSYQWSEYYNESYSNVAVNCAAPLSDACSFATSQNTPVGLYEFTVDANYTGMDNTIINSSFETMPTAFVTVSNNSTGDFAAPVEPMFLQSNYTIYYTNQGVLFTLALSNGQCGDGCGGLFIITNVTSETPLAPQDYTKLYADNITEDGLFVNYTSVTTSYPCSLSSENVAPYELVNNSTWTEVTPFSVNASSCTLSFDIVSNVNTSFTEFQPIGIPTTISLMSYIPPPPKTGGGAVTGGAVSGGGSTPTPAVTYNKTNSTMCATISNFSQYDSVNLHIFNSTFDVTENYITPTTADITVNGKVYVLGENGNVLVGSIDGANYTLKLNELSYVPIADTLTMTLCGEESAPSVLAKPNTTTITITLSTATTTIAGTQNNYGTGTSGTNRGNTGTNGSTGGTKSGSGSTNPLLPHTPTTTQKIATMALIMSVMSALLASLLSRSGR